VISEGEPALHVLLDDDHGHAAAVDLGQRLVQAVDRDRRQAEGDLIEDDQARRGHQRTADGQHLLLAAGQFGPRAAPPLAEHVEELVDRAEPPVPLAGRPGRTGPEQQVLLDREVAENPAAFHAVRDAETDDAVRGPSVDAAPVEPDLAAGDRQHPADRPGRGRLAGTVRAQQGEHFPFRHGERDVVQRAERAVLGRDPLDLQQRPVLAPGPVAHVADFRAT
jgi:hypothetical protein